MRLYHQAALGLALTALILPAQTVTVRADPQAETKSAVSPDVAAVLKQSTDVYKKMKSYQHTAVVVVEGKDETGKSLKQETRYVLALDRPNKFLYKNSTRAISTAVSDGKTFVNFRSNETSPSQFTKTTAPTDYKGINIVDDVTFEPLATYVIALMLQGDCLADKDVRAAMEKATLKPGTVTENGKKWQVIAFNFGGQEPTEIYINAEDHLIGKAVQKIPEVDVKVTETYENVSINKPIPATVFQYTPPAGAKQIQKFPATLPTQRPDDARNAPRPPDRNTGRAVLSV